MSEAELVVLKEKITKVMVDHLTLLGYPNSSNELVMRELKNMWIKLEEAGLTEGLDYQAYLAHANDQFLLSEVNSLLGI